jgi:hypothetical protein
VPFLKMDGTSVKSLPGSLLMEGVSDRESRCHSTWQRWKRSRSAAWKLYPHRGSSRNAAGDEASEAGPECARERTENVRPPRQDKPAEASFAAVGAQSSPLGTSLVLVSWAAATPSTGARL